MEKENLIDLTNKLYRQTLLFPKKEPLRYKIRGAADEVLAKFVAKKPFFNEIEVLKSYFAVAKYQNWVSYFDILEIEKEYDKIAQLKIKKNTTSSLLIEEKNRKIPVSSNNVFLNNDLDPRKRKILKILKEKQKIQVGQLRDILSDVSKRTLRRDFEKLLEQGLVRRVGQRNKTYYSLKIN